MSAELPRALEEAPALEGVAVAEAPAGAPRRADRAQFLRAFWEVLHDISVAVLFCFFVITFVAQAFRVQGTSMLPLLEDGERIIVNKFVYHFRPIGRGDVVVFWYPADPSVSFIKRVVGLPGDRVELRNGLLYVNDHRVDETYLPARPDVLDHSTTVPVEVTRGHYYVLGDHRSGSNDSRNWGQVPAKYIYGRAVFRFWPLSKVGLIH